MTNAVTAAAAAVAVAAVAAITAASATCVDIASASLIFRRVTFETFQIRREAEKEENRRQQIGPTDQPAHLTN